MDVRLPDGRIIRNVPDGTTQKDLMAMLGGGAPASARPAPRDELAAAPRTVPQELGRQVGLTGRHMLGGALSLANIAADPMAEVLNAPVRAYNAVSGSDTPLPFKPPSSMKDEWLDKVFPKPEGAMERIVGVGSEALSGAGVAGAAGKVAKGAMAAPGLMEELAQAPRVQALIDKLPQSLRGTAQKGLDVALAARNTPASAYAEELATAPMLQAAAGMAGATAEDVTKTVTGDPALAGAAGMIGSIASGQIGTLGERTASGLKQAGKAFTKPGRDELVGQALRKISTNPSAAIKALEDAQEIIPGSAPMVSQAAKDYGLMGAESAIKGGFDPTGRIAQRYGEQNTARMKVLDTAAGDDNDIKALERARDRIYKEGARPAFDNSKPIAIGRTVNDNPVLKKIAEIRAGKSGGNPTVKEAMDEAEALMLSKDVNINDAESLYESARKYLAMVADGELVGRGKSGAQLANLKNARYQLHEVIGELDKTIESGAPGYRAYLDAFHQSSIPLDQLRALQDLRRRAILTASDQVSGQAVLSNAKFQSLLSNNMDKGLNLRGKGPGAANLTGEQMATIRKIADDLDRGAAATSPFAKAPGSDTFKNMSIAAVIGRVLGDKTGEAFAETSVGKDVSRAMAWMYRTPETQIQQLMLEAWLDPKLAASLMKKATDFEVKNIGEELKKRAARQAAANALYVGD